MISILVAVYNAERYLRKCLDSLIDQSYKDFEALCIDDASTDKSVEIINEYVARDKRFRLLQMKENSGIAKTHNFGLQHTKGNIITFLDSDDWFDADSLRGIMDTFEQYPETDCAVFRCIMVYEDGRQEKYKGDNFDVLTGQEAFLASLTWRVHGIYAGRSWLYRQHPYDDTCRVYSNDNTTRVHYYVSREVRQSEARYYYLQHSQSATHRVSTDRMMYMIASDNMRHQLQALDCDDKILNVYETEYWKIVIDSYFFYYKNRHLLTKEEKKYCLDEIKKGWGSVDTHRIKGMLPYKLGYIPFKPCWRLFRAPAIRLGWFLFRMEEEVYFALRGLLGKN